VNNRVIALIGRNAAMSENEKIETEEIRFIYKLILDGFSDSEIMNMCLSLKERGELYFPIRVDEGFIKNKRKEMEIASEVLKDSIKKIFKIFVENQRDKHVGQIVEISEILLKDNLNTVAAIENISEVIHGATRKYLHLSKFTINDFNNIKHQVNKLQLIGMFRRNVEEACKRYGTSVLYDCYAAHLNETMGEEMNAMGGFWPAVELKPYEVIQAVKNIKDSKVLEGTCPLCNIENQLPPFIKSTYNDIFRI